MTILKLSAIALLAIALSSCKKDTINEPAPEPEAPAATTGNLKISFNAVVGDSTLVLNTSNYTNQAGNSFNVTMFKYYISNVKLTRVDNSIWTESNSYHLIDHSTSSNQILTLSGVPFGNYKSIEFMIGVDSARNNSGAQTGALDPSNGMFWSWSTGYIMAKMEGTSPQSTATGNKLTFHSGGFQGIYSVLKTTSPSFGNDTAKVSSSVSPTINMSSDLLQWFESPNTVDFSTLNTVHMSGANAKLVADNYTDMFTVKGITNN